MRRTLPILLSAIALGLLALMVKDAPPEERLASAAQRLDQRIREAHARLTSDLGHLRAAAEGGSPCVADSAWAVISTDLRAQRAAIGAE